MTHTCQHKRNNKNEEHFHFEKKSVFSETEQQSNTMYINKTDYLIRFKFVKVLF